MDKLLLVRTTATGSVYRSLIQEMNLRAEIKRLYSFKKIVPRHPIKYFFSIEWQHHLNIPRIGRSGTIKDIK